MTQLTDGAPGPGTPAGRWDGSTSATSFNMLTELVAEGSVIVLSGAGLSTESGIPDYRGPTGRARRADPMTYQTFVGGAAARQRYWARSHVGWRHVARAAPNAGHRAVAELERAGALAGIITQNVDGLHQAAGARQVIELHGSLGWVVCLECGSRTPRATLDERLRAANLGFDELALTRSPSNPDGDVELDEEHVARFRLVGCERCGSDLLKPDVVFFGENVPRPRVERCYALVDAASSLLVLGSSLTVMSGLRFVHRARREGIPVAIVNRGVTRGDPLADVKLDAPLGPTLTGLLAVARDPTRAEERDGRMAAGLG